ncbi:hypothetical protein [Azospirillum sp.]|uniref:hypothetical protein n=1 Tax=Azospirillum sp. TaxID=34012 RepID=UPI002D4B40CD|nr:hypothetical protein [Azospirillum sp.]HYD68558.1 hypothetical protein [Azospirillum sp.]
MLLGFPADGFGRGGKAIAMACGVRWSFRTVVVGLLMLATLLVYAVPGHASPMPHHATANVHEHAAHDHDHGAADAHDATAAVHDHERAPCTDGGLLDDGSCCSVAQCTSMHGGLPAGTPAAFVPRLDRVNLLAALATPDGIVGDPALRPPL